MSVESTRNKNEDALEKLDTATVAGGVLPRDLFEQFYQKVVDEANILDAIRTEDLPRQKMALPRISVGERQREGADEGTGTSSDADVSTDKIDMDVEKGVLSYDLTRESVDDTVDNVDEVILDMLSRQFAVDTQDLGINGDETGSGFVTQNDGWLKILNERTDTNVYDHSDGGGTPQPVNTELFNQAIQTMPNKYLRSDRFEPMFFMNENKLQQYRNSLADRNDPLGSAVIFGESDITPFSYDVMGVAAWPEDTVVFTHPENMIYGLYDEVEIRVLTDTDKVAENDLFARYFMRVRDDFQIEDEEAAVLVEGIETS